MVYLRELLKNTPDAVVAGADAGAGAGAVECVVESTVRQLNKLFSAAVAMHSYQSLEMAELK